MKIYLAGYTRKGSLKIFDNLPLEHRGILRELQLEKMSEGQKDGLVWKIHSHDMYSLTSIQSIHNPEIDERKIPLIASYIMDKEAAHFLMEQPESLFQTAAKLKKASYKEVTRFHQVPVFEEWEHLSGKAITMNVESDKDRMMGIVEAVIQQQIESEKKFAGFVYGTLDDLFGALKILPIPFRMSMTFSFPFPGGGACVGDINIVDADTMEFAKEHSYSGWPLIQRITVPEELQVSEKVHRIAQMLVRFQEEYEEFPIAEENPEILFRKLEKLQDHKETDKKVRKEKEKKNKIFPGDILIVTTMTVLFGILAVMILNTEITLGMKTIRVAISFAPATLLKYILMFAEGMLAGLLMTRKKRKRG